MFDRALAPGGCLLLTDPCRPQGLEFAARLENSGWQVGLDMFSVALEAGPGGRGVAGTQGAPVTVALLTARRD